MGYKTRLKIGKFSRLMQVTVKTLRHYEQKELLIPNEVDEWTGYRYYSIGQMQKFMPTLKNMDTQSQVRHAPATSTASGIRKTRRNGSRSFRFLLSRE